MPQFAKNPKSRHDYEIIDTIETGLVLYGHEVKAVKNGKISIKGSYAKIINNELWLIGATISPYQPNNTPENYDSQRSRKILIKKKELDFLIGKSKEAGLTLVPLSVYSKRGLVKLELGVGRGKKKYDKRESIKKREVQRQIKRATKGVS